MTHPETGHVDHERTADTYGEDVLIIRIRLKVHTEERRAGKQCGPGRLPGSMGAGGRLHCSGTNRLGHDGISGNASF